MIPVYVYSSESIYENVAIDEALFLHGKTILNPLIRVWEQNKTSVVLGRSQDINKEVDLIACQENEIPIARRCSAGGTVIQKSGSLNFVFSFPITWHSSLLDVRKSFKFFAEYVMQALAKKNIPTGYRLLSDITDGQDKKISGNAQSRSQKNIMHHGTLLAKSCSFEIEKYLKHPSTEPEYRKARTHTEFVTSLEEMGYTLNLEQFAEIIKSQFKESTITSDLPIEVLSKSKELLSQKYTHNIWNIEGKRP